MSVVYKPRLVSGATVYNLPQPIMVWDMTLPRRATFHDVPQADGALVYGLTKGPPTISIEGIFEEDTPAEVLAEIKAMETFLDLYQDDFDLYRYYDSVTGEAEFFKECVVTNVSLPRTNRPLEVAPKYSLEVRAMDAKRYDTTGGGAASGDVDVSGELVVTLGDVSGVQKVRIRDSNGNTVATIDSNGNMILKGIMTTDFRGTLT